MGRKATQGDLVSEAVLQNLELLVGAEAIANKYPRLTIGSLSGLRIKYTCEPLQA
jgi:dsRNA-specific ribonuclease